MTRCRVRSLPEVEAFQFQGDGQEGWPEWLAHRQDVTFHGADQPDRRARRILVEEAGCLPVNVYPGDWIVCWAGHLWVYTAPLFAEIYEVVD